MLNERFLVDSIAGHYNDYNENRLTKIFCSSFNSSNAFKKLFFKFIDYNEKNSSKLIAFDQPQEDDCRYDIFIGYHRFYPNIVVENKIEDTLTKKQLQKYDKSPIIKKIKDNKRKIALVKHYFEDLEIDNWTIKHWSEFYLYIKKEKNFEALPEIDKFIIDNFLKYLEEQKMSIPTEIKRKDLNDLRDLIVGLYNATEKNPLYFDLKRKRVFETATNYLTWGDKIFDMLKREVEIHNRVKKNFQFRPKLNRWWDDNKNINFPSIVFEIEFDKFNKNGKIITGIGTGLFFKTKGVNEKFLELWYYTINKKDNDRIYEPPKLFKFKNVLKFDEYANVCINFWKSKLK